MKLLIDNTPIEQLGLRLLENSYVSILQWPQLKAVETNDWAEYAGIEPDLTYPVLDTRKVTLNFYAKGEYEYEQFLQLLTTSADHDFYFGEFKRHYKLRLISNTLEYHLNQFQIFSLEFVDESPLYNAEITGKIDSIAERVGHELTGYSIDSVDVSFWGVSVLEGTRQNVLQLPPIKQRLQINESAINGAVYDNAGDVLYKEQDVTLKFLIRAENPVKLVENYYAFHNFLIRPNERLLFVGETLDEMPFFYKSCSVGEYIDTLNSGLVGIEFDVTICVTERDSIISYYLTDDEGKEYLTEDNNITKLRS